MLRPRLAAHKAASVGYGCKTGMTAAVVYIACLRRALATVGEVSAVGWCHYVSAVSPSRARAAIVAVGGVEPRPPMKINGVTQPARSGAEPSSHAVGDKRVSNSAIVL